MFVLTYYPQGIKRISVKMKTKQMPYLFLLRKHLFEIIINYYDLFWINCCNTEGLLDACVFVRTRSRVSCC